MKEHGSLDDVVAKFREDKKAKKQLNEDFSTRVEKSLRKKRKVCIIVDFFIK